MSDLPIDSTSPTLAGVLHRLHRRSRWVRFIQGFALALPVTLSLAALAAWAFHSSAASVAPFVALGLLGALAFAALAAVALCPNRARLAKMADDRFGLHDLLASAVQLTGNTAAERTVRARAELAAAKIQSTAVIPLQTPRAVRWALVPTAVLVALAVVPIGKSASGLGTTPMAEAGPRISEPLLAQAADRIERLLPEAGASNVAPAVDRLLQKLRDPETAAKDKLSAMYVALQKIEKAQAEHPAQRWRIRAIGAALEKASLLQQAGADLRQGLLKQGATQLRETADRIDQEPPASEARTELSGAAQSAAKSAERLHKPLDKIAQAADKKTEPMDGQSFAALADALDRILGEQDRAGELRNELTAAIRNQERYGKQPTGDDPEAWPQGPGGADDNANADRLARFLEGPEGRRNTEPGDGHDPARLGGGDRPDGRTTPAPVGSVNGSGRSMTAEVKTVADGSLSVFRYRQALDRFARQAEAAIHRGPVPNRYRDLVKTYFAILDRQILPNKEEPRGDNGSE